MVHQQTSQEICVSTSTTCQPHEPSVRAVLDFLPNKDMQHAKRSKEALCLVPHQIRLGLAA